MFIEGWMVVEIALQVYYAPFYHDYSLATISLDDISRPIDSSFKLFLSVKAVLLSKVLQIS